MSDFERDLTAVDINLVKDWNEMIPIIRSIFRTMGGQEKWSLHHEKVMDSLLSCDMLSARRSCRAFLEDYMRDRCEVKLEVPSGLRLCFESAKGNPTGCSYIRFETPWGEEVAYWDHLEWKEAPQEVMGAIMATII